MNKGVASAMDGNSRTTAIIKAQIAKYSGIISPEFSKAKKRLIKELVYGIQASKDVKLSSITRVLNEKIALIKTE